MKNTTDSSRRSFLKTSAAGAAGMIAGSVLPKAVSAAGAAINPPGTRNAWVDGMQVNPDIDNLRMVLVKDTANMLWQTATPTQTWADLDTAAMVLARKTTAADAWATIFRKPATKQWADVKVGMKAWTTLPSIMTKIVDVLHGFGVPYTSFYTWGSDTANNQYWTGAVCQGPQAGVHNVKGTDMGGVKRINVSVSASDGSGKVNAKQIDTFGYLADGFFDIIVNFADDRMHPEDIGHATLCMKNHYGSFCCNVDYSRYGVLHQGGPMYAAMLDVNKLDMCYGGTPIRQQLCIIMAANLQGNDYIAMGTFAPALDYTYIKKIRIALGEDTIANAKQTTLDQFANFYGYTPAQFAALNFIDWKADPTAASPAHAPVQQARMQISISNPAFRPTAIELDLPGHGIGNMSVAIHDQQGRLIRSLNHDGNAIVWNGLSSSGARVPAGSYIVKVSGSGVQSAGSLMLVHR
jgi:hypothetical protein